MYCTTVNISRQSTIARRGIPLHALTAHRAPSLACVAYSSRHSHGCIAKRPEREIEEIAARPNLFHVLSPLSLYTVIAKQDQVIALHEEPGLDAIELHLFSPLLRLP